jgi:hypothetical protein
MQGDSTFQEGSDDEDSVLPNRVISWMPTFANTADYETYNQHPAHVSFINNILKPVLLAGSRAAIQYEIPE